MRSIFGWILVGFEFSNGAKLASKPGPKWTLTWKGRLSKMATKNTWQISMFFLRVVRAPSWMPKSRKIDAKMVLKMGCIMAPIFITLDQHLGPILDQKPIENRSKVGVQKGPPSRTPQEPLWMGPQSCEQRREATKKLRQAGSWPQDRPGEE